MRYVLFLLTFMTVVFLPKIFADSQKSEVVLDKGVVITELKMAILIGAANGAAYVNIQNCGKDKIILYEVKVDPEICKKIELHDHMECTDPAGNKHMEMIEFPAIDIDPGKTLVLKQGGKHIMLMNVNHLSYCQMKNLIFTFCFRKISEATNETIEIFEMPISLPIGKEDKRCER